MDEACKHCGQVPFAPKWVSGRDERPKKRATVSHGEFLLSCGLWIPNGPNSNEHTLVGSFSDIRMADSWLNNNFPAAGVPIAGLLNDLAVRYNRTITTSKGRKK
jgi:hypothetical protein